MRCPKCNYISFDYLENCKKCGTDLSGIKAELCPLEVPPMEVSIWDWLKERTNGTVLEPASGVPEEMGAPSGLEIPLEPQTEEIVIDEGIIMEFEEEKPSTAVEELPSDKVASLDTLEKEITLELSEDFIEKRAEAELDTELATRSDKVESEEISFEELEIPLEISSHSEISMIETDRTPEKTPGKETQEDQEDIDSLLKDLDEILKDED